MVEGNYIGTDASGATAVDNSRNGVTIIDASSNTIGGTNDLNPDGTIRIRRGNVISGNSGDGVLISRFQGSATGNVVAGNYIGTDASGATALANAAAGVFLSGGASNNTIGGLSSPSNGMLSGPGNLISGNDGNGVDVRGPDATGNLVEGNYIGTDKTGTKNVGNLLDGVALLSASGNTIGGVGSPTGNGMLSGPGNLISANRAGIDIEPDPTVPNSGGSTNNLVEGNYIGTQVNGIFSLGNFLDGIDILGGFNPEATPTTKNTIGGLTDGARNLISGNLGHGIIIGGSPATGNLVEGNFIGTKYDGSGTNTIGFPLPFLSNGQGGITIENSASGNTVGGLSSSSNGRLSGPGNVISGNETSGVELTDFASGNLVEGNYIGPDVTGSIVIGNTGSGVELDDFASGNTIGGTTAGARNIISGNLGSGITLQRAAFNNVVQGNFIGTDVTGTKIPLLENSDQPQGNLQNGVSFLNIASDNTIGGTVPGAGNVISGNTGNGVDLSSGSTGNLVLGNTIGLDVTGTSELGNALNGVFINDVSGNTIGGTDPNAGNVISGNSLNGIEIVRGIGKTLNIVSGSLVQGNVVQGNKIGTDASGTLEIGNGQNGVFLDGSPVNTIGGTTSGAGNLISGNLLSGVSFFGPATTGNLLLGNRIGTNAGGTLPVGNMLDGVLLTEAPGNFLGGTEPGSRNLISGNVGNGIEINGSGATGNAVQGDFIGLDINGTYALPNAGDGVVVAGASSNLIGGTSAAARNVVSGNVGNGVTVSNATRVVILGNFIGTDATGTHALGNAADGVLLNTAASNTIGGTTPEARNILSGNSVAGVEIRGGGSSLNLVEGNYIGTDTSGEASLANLVGVFINAASNNTIGGTDPGAGNLISGNSNAAGSGVGVQILGFGATGNLVEGNLIGTDATGTLPRGNDTGVFINDVAGNTIGGTANGARNVISGNTSTGIQLLDQGAGNNVVEGNLIGTDINGTRTLLTSRPNLGILVNNTPGTDVIGGTTAAARNVISGFKVGIEIFAPQSQFNPTAGTAIEGNFIGTDQTGETVLGNDVGVFINGVPLNTIGGTTPGARNVISGNTVGIQLLGATATRNLIQGNFIGLGSDGKAPLGNHTGIFIDAASNNTIGGTTPGAGNVIAGNVVVNQEGSTGIYLFDGAANNTIEGNYIGTDASGRSSRDLAQGDYGVLLFNASNNPIARSLGTNRVVGSGIANLREFTGPVTQPQSSGGGKPAHHHPHHPVHAAPRKRPGFSRLARRPFYARR